MTTYTMHTDPGHGWLAVSMEEINKLGIADKISTYSYRKGETAYLEEDCDCSVFLQAKQARGEPFKLAEKHCNGDSFIRRLPRFH